MFQILIIIPSFLKKCFYYSQVPLITLKIIPSFYSFFHFCNQNNATIEAAPASKRATKKNFMRVKVFISQENEGYKVILQRERPAQQ